MHKIFKTFPGILTAGFLVLGGCSLAVNSPTDSGTPQNPPLPRTPSILPLGSGNQWYYQSTRYDTNGTAHREGDLELELAGGFGQNGTGPLEPVTWQAYYDQINYDRYFYRYEWESSGRGALIAYRDVDTLTPGLYVTGWYRGDSTWLYDKPLLWLRYPAPVGATWQYAPPGASDTTVITLEATNEPFYFHSSVGAAPLRFLPCHRYRETTGDSSSIYYYNDQIGALAWFRYYNTSLVRSYILTGWQVY